MPKGIPKHREHIIVANDTIPLSRQHNEIRTLMQEYTEKARAFFIVDQVLTNRAHGRAMENGPRKLLAAAGARAEARELNGLKVRRTKKRKKKGSMNARGVIAAFIEANFNAAVRALPREHTKADIARQLLVRAGEAGIHTTFGSLAQGVYLFQKNDNGSSSSSAH